MSNQDLKNIAQNEIASYTCNGENIFVSGADAANFLHRVSTNNVVNRNAGDVFLNTFASQKGKLIDCVTQLIFKADKHILVTTNKSAKPLLDWLESYHFVENIDMKIASYSCELVFWQKSCNPDLPKQFQCEPGRFLDDGNSIIFHDVFWISNFLFDGIIRLKFHDTPPSAKSKYKNLSDEEFETFRIASMSPSSTTEVNDAFNPLELGLQRAISFSKGCFIGQEALARQFNYDKVPNKLVGLSVANSDLGFLKPGMKLLQNGKIIGKLTSIAPLYLANLANALAIIKSSTKDGAFEVDAEGRSIIVQSSKAAID